MHLDVWKCHEIYGKLSHLCNGNCAVRADVDKVLTSVMLPVGLLSTPIMALGVMQFCEM